jgi:hypothetical protein
MTEKFFIVLRIRLGLYNKSTFKELQIGVNFYLKLFEWIRDRREKTLIDSWSCERIVLSHLSLIKR